ncbi:MAG: A/G-specific adenine glycosylase [Anaerorhabdus sp.]
MAQNRYAKKIEDWFRANQRELVFRKTKDPYAIWVSEVMAQQTQIKTMLPYYEVWMKKWPTIEMLSKAKEMEVLEVWQGLGYYNRARKLIDGAKQIMLQFQGVFPQDIESIKTIAGIGEYTAGAISSIAFGQENPAVDGNVLRVLTRMFKIEDDITAQKTKAKVTAICKAWISGSHPSDFTQGLMELGATICTFKNPQCACCPMQHDCRAYADQTQLNYPVKKKAKQAKQLHYYTYVLMYKGKICISDDESDGLLKGFKRLPQFGAPIDIKGICHAEGKSKHIFSHRIWNMVWQYIECDNEIAIENARWIKMEDFNEKKLVMGHRKIIKKLNIFSEC